ncbi:MAG: 30S ribosomal protein S8 [Dehalococcoidia bacterium]|nr:30S ribosomal protein S8 [Chloroflexota bacterium]MXW25686.1 30S ribosomal protein S8 [Dehalococcoidia bacterium]MXY87999.1 30S ribosomal protein S8 [Dehalococcoidia bacterium]MXZ88247.1 30S ribosomal protein S8 [Dehalococcoidia bacterium]MYA52780.1 30S ribosomal protein S8 [Dehalococcoidia bacterium]
MTMSDPIADMLTRIRNAVSSRHDAVTIPSSKVKVAIAEVLKSEGFIRDYEVEPAEPQANMKVELSYGGRKQPVINGLQRVSKPGLRVYVQRREIPRVYGGLGVAIISTPKGVMTGQEARRQQVGGEVLCYVW